MPETLLRGTAPCLRNFQLEIQISVKAALLCVSLSHTTDPPPFFFLFPCFFFLFDDI